MSKLSKYALALLGTVAIVLLVWYFGKIVTYILISAVLAIIGKPLVKILTKIHWHNRSFPRWAAALATLIAIWGVAILFVSLFFPLVFNKVSDLASLDIKNILESSFYEPIQSLENWLREFFSIREDFSLIDGFAQEIGNLFQIDRLNEAIKSIVTVIGNTLIALFCITFITFFFLKEENLFQNMVVGLFPKKYEHNVIHALSSVTKLLTRYFTGIIAESTAIMLLLSGIFLIWGFNAETAFFMGVIMGILNVIPYVGPLSGAIICAIVGLVTPLEGTSIVQMIFIIGGTIASVKLADDFILQPLLYSQRVYAHPLEIFLVLLMAGSIGQSLGGIQGTLLAMLLAIPAYTVLRVFAKEFFFNFGLVQQLTEKI